MPDGSRRRRETPRCHTLTMREHQMTRARCHLAIHFLQLKGTETLQLDVLRKHPGQRQGPAWWQGGLTRLDGKSLLTMLYSGPTENRQRDASTSSWKHVRRHFEQPVDKPGPEAHRKIGHLVQPDDDFGVLTVGQLDHRPVIRQAERKGKGDFNLAGFTFPPQAVKGCGWQRELAQPEQSADIFPSRVLLLSRGCFIH